MAAEPIPADVRHRLAGLQLASRHAIGGDGLGLHASRSRGTGLEFAQYRAYEPGDEPRQIDWKLYARSDRFFVREAERESPVAVWILLDASGSMAQADADRPAWSRFAATKLIALCLAELALVGGDRFGWVVLGEDGVRLATPAAGSRQRDRLRRELATLVPGGAFPTTGRLAPIWDRIGANDLVIVLSDWFDPAVLALATRLAAARRETLAIEVLTVAERDFAFDGGHRFRDPETGEEVIGDGQALRAGFIERFGAARDALCAAFDGQGIRHASVVLDEPVDAPLRALFGRGA